MLFAYLSSEWLSLCCLFDEGQGQYLFSIQCHLCGFLPSEFLHPLLVTQNLQHTTSPSGVVFLGPETFDGVKLFLSPPQNVIILVPSLITILEGVA